MDAPCNSIAFRAKAKGFKKTKEYSQYLDGKLVTYRYTITFDRFGTEIESTKPEILGKENNEN